jgi:hypothetical protein
MFARLLGCFGEDCFRNKKVTKWYKRLGILLGMRLKIPITRPLPPKKCVAAIARCSLKTNGSSPTPAAALPAYVALELYYLYPNSN